MNRYMSADEQEHMDWVANSRYDYLSEAFGDEARLLAAQDEQENAEAEGFATLFGRQQSRERFMAHYRAIEAIRRNHAEAVMLPSEDVPF